MAEYLSFARLAAFAAPGAPLLALTLPTLVFLPPYFAEQLGVPLAAVSALFLGARLFDFVIDPLLGAWQDRTRAALGRRRLWLALALVPLCALIWFVFIGARPGTPPAVLAIALLLLYALFSAMMIAHLGWAGELSSDYHGRTRILTAVQIAGAAGQIAILVLPALVALARPQPGAGVHAMGWSLIAALPAAVAVALAFTPERAAKPRPASGLRTALSAIKQNAPLRGVLAPDLMLGVAQGVSGGLFVFFVKYKLGLEAQAEALLLLYFVAALAGAPAWAALARRTSKHRALQIGALYGAASFALIPLLPAGDLRIAAPAMALAGLANGAPTLLLRAMMADVVDEDEARTRIGRAGFFFGMLMTTTKIGQALGPACYGALAAFGFDPRLGAANTPGAMAALTWMFAGLPCALNLLAAAALRGYRLDAARQRALRAQIEGSEI